MTGNSDQAIGVYAGRLLPGRIRLATQLDRQLDTLFP